MEAQKGLGLDGSISILNIDPAYVSVKELIEPEVTSTVDVGRASKRFKTGYFDVVDATNITGSVTVPQASATVLGGVKVGTNLSINPSTGVLSADAQQYTLPQSTSSILGGIRLGNNLSYNPVTTQVDAAAPYTLPNDITVDNVDAKNSSTLVVGGKVSTTQLDLGTNGNTQAINIGTGSGVKTIVIGGGTDDITTVNGNLNVTGTTTSINTTDLDVQDKLITVNKSGAAASGGLSGIQVEENAAISAYIKTNAARDKWVCKAPTGTEFELGASPGAVLTNPTSGQTIVGSSYPLTLQGSLKLQGGVDGDTGYSLGVGSSTATVTVGKVDSAANTSIEGGAIVVRPTNLGSVRVGRSTAETGSNTLTLMGKSGLTVNDVAVSTTVYPTLSNVGMMKAYPTSNHVADYSGSTQGCVVNVDGNGVAFVPKAATTTHGVVKAYTLGGACTTTTSNNVVGSTLQVDSSGVAYTPQSTKTTYGVTKHQAVSGTSTLDNQTINLKGTINCVDDTGLSYCPLATTSFAGTVRATTASGTTTATGNSSTLTGTLVQVDASGTAYVPTAGLVGQDPVEVTISSTQSWTVPPGVTKVKIQMVGGGGGGSAGHVNWPYVGAGGGAGGYVSAILNVSPALSLSLTVGSGGSGGTSVGSSGASGFDSTLVIGGVTVITADGGGGGGAGANSVGCTGGFGATQSTPPASSYLNSSSVMIVNGGDGLGSMASYNVEAVTGGLGGASFFGGGGSGQHHNVSAARAGQAYGSGGGGGKYTTTVAGKNGKSGVVILSYLQPSGIPATYTVSAPLSLTGSNISYTIQQGNTITYSVGNTNTQFEFTGIPTNAKRVSIVFRDVQHTSSNGQEMFIQLGTTSAYATSNYESSYQSINGGTGQDGGTLSGFKLSFGHANSVKLSGTIVLTYLSDNIWIINGSYKYLASAGAMLNGSSPNLGGLLSRIKMYATAAPNLYGTVSILYE